MKKLLLIAVLILGVWVGLFFMDTTPSAPLAVVITAVTNHPGGGISTSFFVSNRTAQTFGFYAYVQAYSNGMWKTPNNDSEPSGGVRWLLPRSGTAGSVSTDRNFQELRVNVTCARHTTFRQIQIDHWLQKLHLPPRYTDRERREIITPLTNFPAR